VDNTKRYFLNEICFRFLTGESSEESDFLSLSSGISIYSMEGL
jgi:hypothetical protein